MRDQHGMRVVILRPVWAARLPLSRAEQRLIERVQAKLPSDEQTLAAVHVQKGPRPGMEFLFPFALFGLCIALLGSLGFAGARRYYTLAVTTRRAILLHSNWIGRPGDIDTTMNVSDIGEVNETTGDLFVDLRGERYWVAGWSAQLARIQGIKQAHSS